MKCERCKTELQIYANELEVPNVVHLEIDDTYHNEARCLTVQLAAATARVEELEESAPYRVSVQCMGERDGWKDRAIAAERDRDEKAVECKRYRRALVEIRLCAERVGPGKPKWANVAHAALAVTDEKEEKS